MAVNSHSESCENVVLGGHSDAAPLIWSDGIVMRGVGPTVAVEILAELGVSVSYAKKTPYSRVMRHLKSGTIDLVAGMVVNDERGEFSKFIHPQLMTISPYTFTRIESELTISSWADLVNLRGVAHRGTVFGDTFDEFASDYLNILRVNTPIDTLQLLDRKHADYALHHRRLGMLQMEILGITNSIAISKDPLTEFSQKIHFAFSEKSPCKYLSSAFSLRLSEYLKTHDIEALLDHHSRVYLEYLENNDKIKPD